MRAELMEKFSSTDPTWEELTQELPLLDAFVHETLRTHPSVIQTARRVCCDIV
jgi:cytochrome P450